VQFQSVEALVFTINGCNEEFLDASTKDNDLGNRVLNGGGKLKSVRFQANVFHLWHKSSWSFTSGKDLHNRRILKQRIAQKEPRC
jgi:hypothetical protein